MTIAMAQIDGRMILLSFQVMNDIIFVSSRMCKYVRKSMENYVNALRIAWDENLFIEKILYHK